MEGRPCKLGLLSLRWNIDIVKKFLTIALIAVLVCLSAALQRARADDPTSLHLAHDPRGVQHLGHPGEKLKIEVVLEGTKKTDFPIRMFAVRDGRFVNLVPDRVFHNVLDQPTYEFSLYSPVVELVYQFALFRPDNFLSLTPRFVLRRPCIPDLDLTKLNRTPSPNYSEEIRSLAREAESLKVDNAGYDELEKLLAKLQKELDHE